MSAAQKLIATLPNDDHQVPPKPGLDRSSEVAREPAQSPALALQAALETAYASAEVETWPEPEVGLWPGWARVAFLVVASAGLWVVVGGGIGLILRR
jgi:hypothetical protein